jgi:hypothetical protein
MKHYFRESTAPNTWYKKLPGGAQFASSSPASTVVLLDKSFARNRQLLIPPPLWASLIRQQTFESYDKIE